MTPVEELLGLLLLIALAWWLSPVVRRYKQTRPWKPSPGFRSPPTVRKKSPPPEITR
jgi:hypothetical protein